MQSAARSSDIRERRQKMEDLRKKRERSNRAVAKKPSLKIDDLVVHKDTSYSTLKQLLQIRLNANERKNQAML